VWNYSNRRDKGAPAAETNEIEAKVRPAQLKTQAAAAPQGGANGYAGATANVSQAGYGNQAGYGGQAGYG